MWLGSQSERIDAIFRHGKGFADTEVPFLREGVFIGDYDDVSLENMGLALTFSIDLGTESCAEVDCFRQGHIDCKTIRPSRNVGGQCAATQVTAITIDDFESNGAFQDDLCAPLAKLRIIKP